jgi:hypothetical protein
MMDVRPRKAAICKTGRCPSSELGEGELSVVGGDAMMAVPGDGNVSITLGIILCGAGKL